MSGSGWYVYAVVEARTDLGLSGLEGVDGRAGLERVEEGELAAVVSPVDLTDFDEEAFRAHVDDLEWLTMRVRRHEDVVEALMASGPLLPMRFGTIYVERDHVRALLRSRGSDLLRALDAIRGRTEWGVKVVRDRPTVEAWLRDSREHLRGLSSDAGAGPGAGYLLRRRLERALEEEVDRATAEVVREVDGALRPLADEVAHGVSAVVADREEVVLDSAYLVADSRRERFHGAVRALQMRHGSHGMRVVLTGPWPAYNFVALDLTAEPVP